jgi:hypothetical protein
MAGRRKPDIRERAHSLVEEKISEYRPVNLPEETLDELRELMMAEAGKYGMKHLPEAK